MYKDFRYINAGENEIYRWGRKAQYLVSYSLKPNERGFYSIECDGGKYWTIGTSMGKYGEFAKYKDTYFKVTKCSPYKDKIYIHESSKKLPVFLEMINEMLSDMQQRFKQYSEEEKSESENENE